MMLLDTSVAHRSLIYILLLADNSEASSCSHDTQCRQQFVWKRKGEYLCGETLT